MKRIAALMAIVSIAIGANAQQSLSMPDVRAQLIEQLRHEGDDGSTKASPSHSAPRRIIQDRPAGVTRAYYRSGSAVGRGMAEVFDQIEEMAMFVCFADDGETVYLQNPISGAFLDTWLRGSLSQDGRTITLPLGQEMWNYGSYGLKIQMVDLQTEDGISATLDYTATEATFTLSEDRNTITLDNSSATHALGICYTDDDAFVGFADFGTVYTFRGDEMLRLPEGLDAEPYVAGGTFYDIQYEAESYVENDFALLARDGNTVYMRGYNSLVNDAWIRGEFDADGNLVVPKSQVVGTRGGYPLFFCSIDDSKKHTADALFTYDASTRTFEATDYIFINADKEDLMHFGYYKTLKYTPASRHDGSYQISDAAIIRFRPEGEQRAYMRNGFAYGYNGERVYLTSQGGMPMNIVFGDNHEVFMQEPISYAEGGNWVKGTLSDDGTKITMPLGQRTYHDNYENFDYATAVLRWNAEKDDYVIDENIAEVTFTIDGDCIRLDDCNAYTIYGLIYTDDYKWSGFGDYRVTYQPVPVSTTAMPEGVEQEPWVLLYTDMYGTQMGQMVSVAFTDHQLYVQGIYSKDPEGVVVGDIEGERVTFASDQYLGNGSGLYTFLDGGIVLPVIGTQGSYADYDYAESVTFVLDRENRKLTIEAEDGCMFVNAGRGSDLVSYMVTFADPTFKYYVERASVPEDPEFRALDDTFYETDTETLCNFVISPFDVDGEYINVDNLYYQIFRISNLESELVELSAENYENLSVNLVRIPYTFTDNYDFGPAGSYFYFYKEYEDLGVQVINTSCGQEKFSNIVWYYNGTQEGSGSSAITTVRSSRDEAIYDLSGLRHNHLQPGLYVVGGRKVLVR